MNMCQNWTTVQGMYFFNCNLYVYTNMYANMNVYTRVKHCSLYLHLLATSCIDIYMYTYIRTYLHTYIHTYIHTSIYVCICTCICICMCTCMCNQICLCRSKSICTCRCCMHMLQEHTCTTQGQYICVIHMHATTGYSHF